MIARATVRSSTWLQRVAARLGALFAPTVICARCRHVTWVSFAAHRHAVLVPVDVCFDDGACFVVRIDP